MKIIWPRADAPQTPWRIHTRGNWCNNLTISVSPRVLALATYMRIPLSLDRRSFQRRWKWLSWDKSTVSTGRRKWRWKFKGWDKNDNTHSYYETHGVIKQADRFHVRPRARRLCRRKLSKGCLAGPLRLACILITIYRRWWCSGIRNYVATL